MTVGAGLVLILKERLLHTIVNHDQPVLRGSGTLAKMIGLRFKLTRPLLSTPQLSRKLMCEVHGTRAILLGSFSGPVKESQNAVRNIVRWHSLIMRRPLRGVLDGSGLLSPHITDHAHYPPLDNLSSHLIMTLIPVDAFTCTAVPAEERILLF